MAGHLHAEPPGELPRGDFAAFGLGLDAEEAAFREKEGEVLGAGGDGAGLVAAGLDEGPLGPLGVAVGGDLFLEAAVSDFAGGRRALRGRGFVLARASVEAREHGEIIGLGNGAHFGVCWGAGARRWVHRFYKKRSWSRGSGGFFFSIQFSGTNAAQAVGAESGLEQGLEAAEWRGLPAARDGLKNKLVALSGGGVGGRGRGGGAHKSCG